MDQTLCTSLDKHMKQLCHVNLMISWVVTLEDGTTVYGDYDRPGHENAWIKLKNHCEKNDILPTKVKLYMFGVEPIVFFEDPNGLNGLSILRGVAKEQSMSGNHANSFQFLTVLLLNDDCEHITAKKFVWPQNQFEQGQETRDITHQNIEQMIFKNGSEKHQKVQEYLYGETV